MAALAKCPSFLRINPNMSIGGALEEGGLEALKEEGINSILYICPDSGDDSAYAPSGFHSLVCDATESETFSEKDIELMKVPFDVASPPFAAIKKPIEEVRENNRFLAAIRQYAEYERALNTLPRPTHIMCKSNRRAGCVASVYEAVRSGISFDALVKNSVHPWHGNSNMATWAETVVNAFFRRSSPQSLHSGEGGVHGNQYTPATPEATAEAGMDFPFNPSLRPPLLFRQLFEKESSTYTYLLGDMQSREAILIDPVDLKAERDFALCEKLGLNLRYVVNTHVHADHITGTGALKQLCTARNLDIKRNAPAASSPSSKAKADRSLEAGESQEERRVKVSPCKSAISAVSGADCDLQLSPGDSIPFGNRKIIVLPTPGHTAGCISFLLDDGSAVFTGDALLIGGCGRTDFQEGSSDTLYQSVHSEIFSLPDGTAVYPAHDYNGNMQSSVREERMYNNRLAVVGLEHLPPCASEGKLGGGPAPKGPISMEQFREIMDALQLPRPKMIDEALPANLKCGLP